jgi:hypothetical protein
MKDTYFLNDGKAQAGTLPSFLMADPVQTFQINGAAKKQV